MEIPICPDPCTFIRTDSLNEAFVIFISCEPCLNCLAIPTSTDLYNAHYDEHPSVLRLSVLAIWAISCPPTKPHHQSSFRSIGFRRLILIIIIYLIGQGVVGVVCDYLLIVDLDLRIAQVTVGAHLKTGKRSAVIRLVVVGYSVWWEISTLMSTIYLPSICPPTLSNFLTEPKQPITYKNRYKQKWVTSRMTP